jgi:hypothetical protein
MVKNMYVGPGMSEVLEEEDEGDDMIVRASLRISPFPKDWLLAVETKAFFLARRIRNHGKIQGVLLGRPARVRKVWTTYSVQSTTVFVFFFHFCFLLLLALSLSSSPSSHSVLLMFIS